MRKCPTCGGDDIIMVNGQWICAADETVVPDADLAPIYNGNYPDNDAD